MRHLPAFVTALAVSLFPLVATPQSADRAGVEQTIRSQIDAFLADDFARAFTFAAPNIKGIFGTPENFGAMVRNGYPMVHRPRSVRMLELREVAGALWQRVLVTDAEGRTHVLDYQMLATPEGWQINGVQLLKAAGVGA